MHVLFFALSNAERGNEKRKAESEKSMLKGKMKYMLFATWSMRMEGHNEIEIG